MIPRELVKRTLDFAAPSRVPRQLWVLPWAKQAYGNQVTQIQYSFPDDICWSPSFLKVPTKVQGDPFVKGTYIDEWGCIFENKHGGIIGEVKQPLLNSWNELDNIKAPDELLTVDINQVDSFCKSVDQFVLAGCCPRPFERLQFIRKTDNVFMDIAEQPQEMLSLINIIHQSNIKEFELWAKTEVDGLFFMDDWGSQNSLLIAPQVWRAMFKPLYKEYVDIAHAHGKYAFMHSDGFILDILADLVELGLDAVNCQLFCMGVEELGQRFKGKITFWGEIDRQHILPHGSTEEVENAVRLVQNKLYANGGVIAQCEFGPGAKPENVYAVFKTWDLFKF